MLLHSSLIMQIFPINMKGSAGSLVTLVNWLGSWIASYAFNFLLIWSTYGIFFWGNTYGKFRQQAEENFGRIVCWCMSVYTLDDAGTFFIFASICGITVVFVERLVPETKGRTLEEIQGSMSSSLTPFHKWFLAFFLSEIAYSLDIYV